MEEEEGEKMMNDDAAEEGVGENHHDLFDETSTGGGGELSTLSTANLPTHIPKTKLTDFTKFIVDNMEHPYFKRVWNPNHVMLLPIPIDTFPNGEGYWRDMKKGWHRKALAMLTVLMDRAFRKIPKPTNGGFETEYQDANIKNLLSDKYPLKGKKKIIQNAEPHDPAKPFVCIFQEVPRQVTNDWDPEMDIWGYFVWIFHLHDPKDFNMEKEFTEVIKEVAKLEVNRQEMLEKAASEISDDRPKKRGDDDEENEEDHQEDGGGGEDEDDDLMDEDTGNKRKNKKNKKKQQQQPKRKKITFTNETKKKLAMVHEPTQDEMLQEKMEEWEKTLTKSERFLVQEFQGINDLMEWTKQITLPLLQSNMGHLEFVQQHWPPDFEGGEMRDDMPISPYWIFDAQRVLSRCVLADAHPFYTDISNYMDDHGRFLTTFKKIEDRYEKDRKAKENKLKKRKPTAALPYLTSIRMEKSIFYRPLPPALNPLVMFTQIPRPDILRRQIYEKQVQLLRVHELRIRQDEQLRKAAIEAYQKVQGEGLNREVDPEYYKTLTEEEREEYDQTREMDQTEFEKMDTLLPDKTRPLDSLLHTSGFQRLCEIFPELQKMAEDRQETVRNAEGLAQDIENDMDRINSTVASGKTILPMNMFMEPKERTLSEQSEFIRQRIANREKLMNIQSAFKEGSPQYRREMNNYKRNALAQMWTKFMDRNSQLSMGIINTRSWFNSLKPSQYWFEFNMSSANLSPFGNIITTMQVEADQLMRINTNFDLFFILLTSSLASSEYSFELRPNVSVTGGAGQGKSWMLLETEQLSVPGATLNVSHMTPKAFNGPQDWSDLTFVLEEMPLHYLGLDRQGNTIPSDESFKNRLTNPVVATLAPDQNSKDRMTKLYLTRCMHVYLWASNDAIPRDSPIASRVQEYYMQKRSRYYMHSQAMYGDQKEMEKWAADAVRHQYRLVHLYKILWDKAIETGVLCPINDRACGHVFERVFNHLEAEYGIPHPEARHMTMLRAKCRVLAMINGIYMELFSPRGRKKHCGQDGNPKKFVPDYLLDLEKWGFVTEEMVVFAMTLHADLCVPRWQSIIARAIARAAGVLRTDGSMDADALNNQARREVITTPGSSIGEMIVEDSDGVGSFGNPNNSRLGSFSSNKKKAVISTSPAPGGATDPQYIYQTPQRKETATKPNPNYIQFARPNLQTILSKINAVLEGGALSKPDLHKHINHMAMIMVRSRPHQVIEDKDPVTGELRRTVIRNLNNPTDRRKANERLSAMIIDRDPERENRMRVSVATQLVLVDHEQALMHSIRDSLRHRWIPEDKPRTYITGVPYRLRDGPHRGSLLYETFDVMTMTHRPDHEIRFMNPSYRSAVHDIFLSAKQPLRATQEHKIWSKGMEMVKQTSKNFYTEIPKGKESIDDVIIPEHLLRIGMISTQEAENFNTRACVVHPDHGREFLLQEARKDERTIIRYYPEEMVKANEEFRRKKLAHLEGREDTPETQESEEERRRRMPPPPPALQQAARARIIKAEPLFHDGKVMDVSMLSHDERQRYERAQEEQAATRLNQEEKNRRLKEEDRILSDINIEDARSKIMSQQRGS